MNTEIYNLFPTLVIRAPEFLSKEECGLIFNYIQNKPLDPYGAFVGVAASNFSLTQDILSELVKNIPELKDLVKNLTAVIEEYKIKHNFPAVRITNSWTNTQQEGSVLIDHTHSKSVIAGALYINVDDGSSHLVLKNPNPYIKYAVLGDTPTEYAYEWSTFKPNTGDLILFPGWIEHGSNHQINQTKDRMVLSFNTESYGDIL
jgi:uncharacterized protein (TIGR02466 family)